MIFRIFVKKLFKHIFYFNVYLENTDKNYTEDWKPHEYILNYVYECILIISFFIWNLI